MILIGIVSFISIRFAFQVGFATNDIVAIWPAAALSYWAVRRFGPWAMLPIFLADAIHLTIYLPHLIPFGYLNGLGNAVAPWISVILERLFSKTENPFESVRSTLASILVGMGSLSIIAALIGAPNISLHFNLPFSAAFGLFWQWVLSDFTGCLVFAPVLFFITKIRITPNRSKPVLVDSLVVLFSIIGVWLAAVTGFSASLGYYPTVFLTMPAMIWLSLRDDTPRIMLGLTLLAVGAFIFTIQTTDTAASTSWMAIQLYVVVIVLLAYIVHAMQVERIGLVKTLAKERDILEERVKERTQELEQLATIDALTGALNRRSFFSIAEEEFKRARGEKPISVILLDIDKFKTVNDTFGHAAGDAVLVRITQTIQSMIRGGADKLARMGGEEFAIILPETTLDGAAQTAERLCKAIQAISFESKKIMPAAGAAETDTFNITCSFGVAEWELEGQPNIHQVLFNADNALYEAKHSGRNRVVAYKQD